MSTIFEALRQDHDVQRDLLQQLVHTEGDSNRRHDLLRRTRIELEHHAAAEERAFYIPLMDSDLTQEKARHSVAEHHEMDELVATLESTDPASATWLHYARKLQEMVHHHLEEEEQEVFQQAGRVLSDQRKQDLGSQYTNERKEMASNE